MDLTPFFKLLCQHKTLFFNINILECDYSELSNLKNFKEIKRFDLSLDKGYRSDVSDFLKACLENLKRPDYREMFTGLA